MPLDSLSSLPTSTNQPLTASQSATGPGRIYEHHPGPGVISLRGTFLEQNTGHGAVNFPQLGAVRLTSDADLNRIGMSRPPVIGKPVVVAVVMANRNDGTAQIGGGLQLNFPAYFKSPHGRAKFGNNPSLADFLRAYATVPAQAAPTTATATAAANQLLLPQFTQMPPSIMYDPPGASPLALTLPPAMCTVGENAPVLTPELRSRLARLFSNPNGSFQQTDLRTTGSIATPRIEYHIPKWSPQDAGTKVMLALGAYARITTAAIKFPGEPYLLLAFSDIAPAAPATTVSNQEPTFPPATLSQAEMHWLTNDLLGPRWKDKPHVLNHLCARMLTDPAAIGTESNGKSYLTFKGDILPSGHSAASSAPGQHHWFLQVHFRQHKESWQIEGVSKQAPDDYGVLTLRREHDNDGAKWKMRDQVISLGSTSTSSSASVLGRRLQRSVSMESNQPPVSKLRTEETGLESLNIGIPTNNSGSTALPSSASGLTAAHMLADTVTPVPGTSSSATPATQPQPASTRTEAYRQLLPAADRLAPLSALLAIGAAMDVDVTPQAMDQHVPTWRLGMRIADCAIVLEKHFGAEVVRAPAMLGRTQNSVERNMKKLFAAAPERLVCQHNVNEQGKPKAQFITMVQENGQWFMHGDSKVGPLQNPAGYLAQLYADAPQDNEILEPLLILKRPDGPDLQPFRQLADTFLRDGMNMVRTSVPLASNQTVLANLEHDSYVAIAPSLFASTRKAHVAIMLDDVRQFEQSLEGRSLAGMVIDNTLADAAETYLLQRTGERATTAVENRKANYHDLKMSLDKAIGSISFYVSLDHGENAPTAQEFTTIPAGRTNSELVRGFITACHKSTFIRKEVHIRSIGDFVISLKGKPLHQLTSHALLAHIGNYNVAHPQNSASYNGLAYHLPFFLSNDSLRSSDNKADAGGGKHLEENFDLDALDQGSSKPAPGTVPVDRTNSKLIGGLIRELRKIKNAAPQIRIVFEFATNLDGASLHTLHANGTLAATTAIYLADKNASMRAYEQIQVKILFNTNLPKFLTDGTL